MGFSTYQQCNSTLFEHQAEQQLMKVWGKKMELFHCHAQQIPESLNSVLSSVSCRRVRVKHMHTHNSAIVKKIPKNNLATTTTTKKRLPVILFTWRH